MDVAVAVPMFMRVDRLDRLFKSIENTGLETVYVADNGEMTDQKKTLYNQNHDFDLTIFDLEFDSGVGHCRRVLTEKTHEDILLFVDSDMLVPQNYELLVSQIQARTDVGGIGGVILEPELGRVTSNAGNIREEDGTVQRGNWHQKSFEQVADAHFSEFDYIQQAAIFRRECLNDYTWDSTYKNTMEHIDFFMGHHRQTDWTFGLCPQVLFPHFPGGSLQYQANRGSQNKQEAAYDYFCEKWGCDGYESGDRWLDTVYFYEYNKRTKLNRLSEIYSEQGPVAAAGSVARYGIRKLARNTPLNRIFK